MNRQDCKQLLLDLNEVYEKALVEVDRYVKDTAERDIFENGVKRTLAVLPTEKRKDGISGISEKAKARAQGLIDKWLQSEKAFFELHGPDVTDDIKVLNPLFSPSLEQLQGLALKYFNKNMTMERAIFNYCKDDRGLTDSLLALPHTQPHETRKEIVEMYHDKILYPRFVEYSLNRLYGKQDSFSFGVYCQKFFETYSKRIL